MLYCTLIRSKLQYASVVRNSITSNAGKLECIQQKLFNLCHCHSFNSLQWNYIKDLITWNSLLPSLWRHHINTFFLLNIYSSSEFFPALLETAGLQGPTWDLRYYTSFNVHLKCCNCPARCTSAAHAIHKDTGIFNRSILMNDMLNVNIFPK
jgi:hypothetical protein